MLFAWTNLTNTIQIRYVFLLINIQYKICNQFFRDVNIQSMSRVCHDVRLPHSATRGRFSLPLPVLSSASLLAYQDWEMHGKTKQKQKKEKKASVGDKGRRAEHRDPGTRGALVGSSSEKTILKSDEQDEPWLQSAAWTAPHMLSGCV